MIHGLRHSIVMALVSALVWIVCPDSPDEGGDIAVTARGPGDSQVQTVRPPAVAQPPVEPVDDDDEAEIREAMARRSIQENCLICHSEDMIAGQRLTPVQWKAEIEKMINWGAPLPKNEESPLIDYLAKHYSDRSTPPVPIKLALKDVGTRESHGPGRDPASVEGDLGNGARFFAANCATCHGSAGLGGDLGPSLARKPILAYPGEYEKIVRQGIRRMPGFQAILKPKDPSDVLTWLRSLAYPAAKPDQPRAPTDPRSKAPRPSRSDGGL